jgi:predicted NAD/FAD-binding protein
MRIAVVGSGISGNLVARLLASAHQVELFEASTRVGGHAQTVRVEAYGRSVEADVAFMVLNRRTYPNFCRMLDLLGVETQESDMSLSVRCLKTGLEYQGSSLQGLFAQRSNLFRPSFHRMLMDIARFNRKACEFCSDGDQQTLLGDFLNELKLGRDFRERYLIPMSAAIWSADPASLDRFPAKFILGFFRNHGLLQLTDRPQWLTIKERSQRYVTELIRPIEDQIRVNSGVSSVQRTSRGVQLRFTNGESAEFDHVVLACHADQSLKMLVDASPLEREMLSAFPYQLNTAVLHTDASVLPTRRRAWASWNYHIPSQESRRVNVTYDLNRLQQLNLPGPLCLTLNPNSDIDSRSVLQRFEFTHPEFSLKSVDCQRRYREISGVDRVSFCGAYWGYGFHEDGVNSALAAVQPFGLTLDALRNPVCRTQFKPDASDRDSVGSESSVVCS